MCNEFKESVFFKNLKSYSPNRLLGRFSLVKDHIDKIANLERKFFVKDLIIFFGFGVNMLVPINKSFCLGKPAYCAWWGSYQLGGGSLAVAVAVGVDNS